MAASLLIRAGEPPVTPLSVPKAWAVADDRLPRLEWRAELDHHTVATWETLAGLVKLAHADLPEIEGFARRWGVLGVDEAGRPGPPVGSRPITELERLLAQDEDRGRRYVKAYVHGGPAPVDQWWEPISSWHHVAARFQAILRLAADRQDQRASDGGDIQAALAESTGIETWFGQRDQATRPDTDRDVAEGQEDWPERGEPSATRRDQVLEEAVGALLAAFPFRLRFTARAEGPPRLEVGLGEAGEDAIAAATPGFPRDWAAYVYPGPALYPTLVLQIVTAVWWPLGLVRCGWCGNPYPQPAERSPRRDRSSFCSPSCRTASKMAKDRERARQRYASRRSTAGEPAQE